MLEFRDYNVRVWSDGDVSMSVPSMFEYGTLGGMDGIQCNVSDYTNEYKEIYAAARDVADALRRLDAAIGKTPRGELPEWR